MPARLMQQSIVTSHSMSKLSPLAALTFVHLLLLVDDYGRYDGRMIVLSKHLHPARTVSCEETEELIRELIDQKMIRFYTVDGEPYLQVTNWMKYQKPRANKPKYPGPDGAEEVDVETEESDEPRKPMKQKDALGDAITEFAVAHPDVHDLHQALTDYADYRRERKKPLTSLSLKKLCDKLEEEIDPADWVTALNTSIANGWQGVFDPKGGNGHADNNKRSRPATAVRAYDIDGSI